MKLIKHKSKIPTKIFEIESVDIIDLGFKEFCYIQLALESYLDKTQSLIKDLSEYEDSKEDVKQLKVKADIIEKLINNLNNAEE